MAAWGEFLIFLLFAVRVFDPAKEKPSTTVASVIPIPPDKVIRTSVVIGHNLAFINHDLSGMIKADMRININYVVAVRSLDGFSGLVFHFGLVLGCASCALSRAFTS